MRTFLLSIFILLSFTIQAQPFTFRSAGLAKEFRLDIYYHNKGKGAFIQYHGQKGIIPLQIKSYNRDTSERSSGQPDEETYVWDEIIDGKITGSYGFSIMHHTISNAWYLRRKDQRKFNLEYVTDTAAYNGWNKIWLHGAQVQFNHYYSDTLKIIYGDGKTVATLLPGLETPQQARQEQIADYNFDGYDDIAFSIPDAGMGVYREFTIYLYDPSSKRFREWATPDYPAGAKCSCLCDVTLNPLKKQLRTSCRGGARWWQDVYKVGSNNKLIWVKGEAVTE